MRILIKIMYDGSNYCGWQFQPNEVTIQGEIEKAIECACGERVSLIGSGRTDSGVHALSQSAHFDLNKPFNLSKLPNALNFYLNRDIRIISAKKVANSFHARFSCIKKTYIYKMYLSNYDNPLKLNRELRLSPNIDINLMKECSTLFLGTHDFKNFMTSTPDIKNTIRTIHSCSLTHKNKSLTFSITANGFLYNMVRKIISSLISISSHSLTPSQLQSLLSLTLTTPIKTAPAYALYLKSTTY